MAEITGLSEHEYVLLVCMVGEPIGILLEDGRRAHEALKKLAREIVTRIGEDEFMKVVDDLGIPPWKTRWLLS